MAKRALQYLLTFNKHRSAPELNLAGKPVHLMFNMATGSGKTLVMAATILYYYEQGYRRFLFFVDRKTVVDKTGENFINKYHNKYLFAENVAINGQLTEIKAVNMFKRLPAGN